MAENVSNNRYPHVFAPITVRGLYYKNRLELSPPGAAGTGDEAGHVTPALLNWFRPFAKGGTAVITVGNCSIDRTECFDEGGQIDLGNDGVIPSLSTFAEMCATYGAIGQLEINHCGATQGNVAGTMAGETGWAPSAVITPAARVRAKMAGTEPLPTREMSASKIAETVKKFADAALRCKKAGMRSVMFHGAHGNLLAQFLSPYFNHRTDEYGGSVENRSRFAREVLQAVREAVGEDVVIEYRISADEGQEGHTRFAETLEFIGYIREWVDILHVSGGLHDTQGEPWVMRPMIQPYTYPDRYNVAWAAEIKRTYPDLLINVVGSVKSVAQAEEIIASGKTDFVSFMRGLIADPEMPRKAASGRDWEHMPCLRCQCIKIDKKGRFSGPCSVNPIAGYYGEYPEMRVNKAPVKKRVAVIGGGPAGVQALKTLLERGHEVTLFEKGDTLGGQVIKAAEPGFKSDMRQYLEYLRCFAVNAVQESEGSKIVTGVEATPELVAEGRYDAIVVALGAKPYVPAVPGIERTEWVADYSGDAKNIAIIGAGAVGLECAIDLARGGAAVTVYEMTETHGLGSDMSPLGGGDDILQMCSDAGVEIRYGVRLTGVEDGRILTDKGEFAADKALLAAGMVPLTELGNRFRSAAPATEIYLVGDCKEVGDIRDATRSAFEICRSL